MQNKNIQILSGTDAALRLQGREDVMRRFVLELPRTGMLIRELLAKDSTDIDAPERVVAKRCDQTWDKVRQNLASVVLQENEVAGMAYYQEVGEWEGRRVFEIGGNVVLPEFRGSHFSTELAESCMQEVLNKDPNALCLGQSSSAGILSRYDRWVQSGIAKDISPRDFENMKRKHENDPPLSTEELDQVSGWYEGTRIILIDMQAWASTRQKN